MAHANILGDIENWTLILGLTIRCVMVRTLGTPRETPILSRALAKLARERKGTG